MTQTTYELIGFDMDGTLLDTNKHVLPSSIEAIGRATAAGKTVAICSGRCPTMIYLNRDDLPQVRYAICASGAVLLDLRERKILEEHDIDHEQIRAIVSIVGDADVMYEVFSGEGFYLKRDCIDHLERYALKQYETLYRSTGNAVEDIREVLFDESRAIYKINVHCMSRELREVLRPQLKALPLEVFDSEYSSIELSRKGIDKGVGLLGLADLLGIDRAATIGVGDADNDLAMLRKAGLGVAMGNACENALAAAQVVVADNDHGGCAEAIDKYLLQG